MCSWGRQFLLLFLPQNYLPQNISPRHISAMTQQETSSSRLDSTSRLRPRAQYYVRPRKQWRPSQPPLLVSGFSRASRILLPQQQQADRVEEEGDGRVGPGKEGGDAVVGATVALLLLPPQQEAKQCRRLPPSKRRAQPRRPSCADPPRRSRDARPPPRSESTGRRRAAAVVRPSSDGDGGRVSARRRYQTTCK